MSDVYLLIALWVSPVVITFLAFIVFVSFDAPKRGMNALGWILAALHRPALHSLADSTHLLPWLERVNAALIDTNARYPFFSYGTDWLGFAHLVIAVAFIGPYIDPVRNKWVITFGLIACAGVIPLAFIAGPIRGIPIGWRLIDSSFGLIGCIPLLICRSLIRKLEMNGPSLPR